MMKKTLNPRRLTFKCILVLPVVAALFFTFCTKETSPELIDEKSTAAGVVITGSLDEPVYIVDGIKRERMDDIDPATLHSIQVLKGASAAEYLDEDIKDPDQASVVLITTKAALPPKEPAGQLNIQNDTLKVSFFRYLQSDTIDINLPDTKSFSIRSVQSGSNSEPIVYLDGERLERVPQDIDNSNLKSFSVYSAEAAFDKFGTEEARQRGVIMITSKGKQ